MSTFTHGGNHFRARKKKGQKILLTIKNKTVTAWQHPIF